MAQVIRKFLAGGKQTAKKPVIIEIAGNPYDVQNVKESVYRNLDLYILNKLVNDKTKKVILDYYDYLFPAMMSGQVTYTDIKPRSFVVAPEWESDGTFNIAGHGLLKHDIIDDKKAGINFGTDLIYELIDKGVIKPYVAPEKQSIPLRSALENKIAEKYFSGNPDAYKEGWAASSLSDRKTMVRDAFAELDFDSDLYKGVEIFNLGKQNFIDAFTNNTSDEDLALKFNNLGGYGLKSLLGITEPEKSESEEKKPITRDLLKEQLRQLCIADNVLEENLDACVKTKLKSIEQELKKYKEFNDAVDKLNLYQTAAIQFNDFGKTSKGQWYAKYRNATATINIDNLLNRTDLKNLDNLDQAGLEDRLGSLRRALIDPVIFPFDEIEDLSTLQFVTTKGLVQGIGNFKAILGSEDWSNFTIIAINLKSGQLRIMSMFDFPEVYGSDLSAEFIKNYNKKNGVSLPDNFYDEYNKLVESAKVQSNKKGGILKAESGDALYRFFRPEEKTISTVFEEPLDDEIKPKSNGRPLALKDYQVALLVGLSGDIAMTVGAFTGGPVNPLTHLGVLGSIGGYAYSDFADPEVPISTGMSNLFINSLLGGMSYIPGLNILKTPANLAKAVVTVKKIAPWLLSAFAVVNAGPDAIKALHKATEPNSKLSYDDWKAINHGISAVLAVTRAGKISNKVKKQGKTEEVNSEQKAAPTEEQATPVEELAAPVEEAVAAPVEEGTAGTPKAEAPKKTDAPKIMHTKPRYNLVTKSKTSKLRTREARESALYAFGVSKGNTSKLLIGSEADTRIRSANEAINHNNGYVVTDKDKVVRIVSKLGPGFTEVSTDTPVYIKVNNSTVKTTLGDALLSGYHVKFNKQGGFIANVLFKYAQGGDILKFQNAGKFRNITLNKDNGWYTDIFTPYFKKLLEQLDTIKDNDTELDNWISKTNEYQSKHANLFKDYDENGLLSYNPEVKEYQNYIINDRNYVNELGIVNGWNLGRYTRNHSTNSGDGVLTNGSYKFNPDGLGGDQTLDRRVLGKASDFTSESLQATNNELRSRGVEMYADTDGYMKARRIDASAPLTDMSSEDNPQLTSGEHTPESKGLTPHLDKDGKQMVDEQGRPLYEDKNGTVVNFDPETGIATANSEYDKSTLSKVKDFGLKVLDNVNMADVLALYRAIRAQKANNKARDILRETTVHLDDPIRKNAVIFGDYNSLALSQNLAGQINATAARSGSNDSRINAASRLEGSSKSALQIWLGAANHAAAFLKSSQFANEIANENAAEEVKTRNSNDSAIIAHDTYLKQLDANTLLANEQQVWQPYLANMESFMRESDTLKKQTAMRIAEKLAEIEANSEMRRLENDLYNLLNESWTRWQATAPEADKNNLLKWRSEFMKSPEYTAIMQKMENVLNELELKYYAKIEPILEYRPFRKPTLATPGIVRENDGYLKSGGSLTYGQRMALKQADHNFKSIREARRNSNREMQEVKKELRRALRDISKLTADLVRKAVGII